MQFLFQTAFDVNSIPAVFDIVGDISEIVPLSSLSPKPSAFTITFCPSLIRPISYSPITVDAIKSSVSLLQIISLM